MTSYEPLSAPEIWNIDTSASAAELRWKRVAFFGWMIADRLWGKRIQPIVEKIEAQLQLRATPDPSIWGDDVERRGLAEWLCAEIAGNFGWSNDCYVPSDPIYVLMWAHEDGLDLESLVLTIEEKLTIELDREQVAAWFHGKTLGDVVDELLAKTTNDE